MDATDALIMLALYVVLIVIWPVWLAIEAELRAQADLRARVEDNKTIGNRGPIRISEQLAVR